MCKKTKRFIGLLLTMVMLLGKIPMVGFAAETDTQTGADPVSAEFCVTAAPAVEMPDNEELFAYFAQRELYGQDMAVYGTAAGEKLNTVEQAIYGVLKTNVETVAIKGGSTAFAVSGISGLKTVWSNEDLGVSSIEDLNAVGDAFEAQFVLGDIVTALLHDCPLDLYWYDKTVGIRMNYQVEVSGYQDDGQVVWNSATVADLVFTFAVSDEYESGANVVTTDVAGIANVKNTAAQIVANNAEKSDYEKLVAYKDYICEAVSYNHIAADDETTPYGNPWQLVYVFDGDGNTNVVCEGYSKAFQYLCDLTTFTNGTACYTVSGQMDGGNHMWNIVTMGGSHYLVDVTNSDLGAIGQNGGLFLAGGNGSIGAGYTVSQCLYTYDAETVSSWGEGTDSILAISDKNYTPDGNTEGGENLVASGTCGDNLTWTLDAKGTLTIAGAGEIWNSPWESYRDSIKAVVIEEGVTSLGYDAFQGCSSLTEIIIPGSVTRMGEYAFENCSSLETVTISEGVTGLGWGTFVGCSSLREITLPKSLISIGPYAFDGCSSLTEITIPESVTNINMGAFSGCSSLTEIIIPGSVTRMGEYAFSRCSSLTEITIPESVTNIERYAFSGCSKLSEIMFTGPAPEFDSGVFSDVTATVYYPAGNETWTEDVMQDYGGNITWVAVGDDAENPFTDVPEGAFYCEPVLWAVENGITNGTSETTFGSDGICLRAHVVTFLHRAAGNPDPASTNNPFTDVASDGFFYKPVLWAVEKGITNGTSATTFGSYDNCNRAAVVTFLWRAAGSPEPTSISNPFVDVNTTDFFYKAVLWAVENGITNGVDDSYFGPTQSCNRAQVVTFLYRANAE